MNFIGKNAYLFKRVSCASGSNFECAPEKEEEEEKKQKNKKIA
jgi:hypothetical protein